jgi:hypothetical protein
LSSAETFVTGAESCFRDSLATTSFTLELGFPWEDSEFPAGANSLGFTNGGTVPWKRISEIFSDPKIFKGGIDPLDIE